MSHEFSICRNDRAGFAAANLTFHTLIYAGVHNDIITEFATGLAPVVGAISPGTISHRGAVVAVAGRS